MKTNPDKPHCLRSMKELAERLPAGTLIRYAAMAENRRRRNAEAGNKTPKKDWHAERVRIGRIAMDDHIRRMERTTP